VRREILITNDGSTTIHLPEWDEQYHSKHGAIQEAYHVFINSGLHLFKDHDNVSILEIGFGTGLNCFITFLEANKQKLTINYVGVEGYPVEEKEIKQLNYISELKAKEFSKVFENMHSIPWNTPHQITNSFSLIKRQQFFKEITDKNRFELIYFDAFGARVQPELWTVKIFEKMANALKMNGKLVTYAAKGSVRRAMQEAGLHVERLPGPPGKREMLRATKL